MHDRSFNGHLASKEVANANSRQRRDQSFSFYSEPPFHTLLDMEEEPPAREQNGRHSTNGTVSSSDFIPERTTPKARRNSSKRTRTSSRSSPKQAKTSSEGQSSPKSNRNSSNTGDDLPQMRTVNNNGTSANGSSVLIRLDTSTSNSSCSSPGPVLDTSSVLRKPASKTTTALITTAPTSTTNDLSSVGASVLASHGLLMTRGSLGVGVGGAGGGGTFSMANQLTPRRPPGFPGPGPRMGLVHQQQQQHYRGLDAHNDTITSNQSEQFHASTSESLAHCSDKILSHYNRLVTVIGWRPLVNTRSTNSCLACLVGSVNVFYLLMILVLLITGYILQYATCFRQDNLSAYDPLLFDPILPTTTLPPTSSPHLEIISFSKEIDLFMTSEMNGKETTTIPPSLPVPENATSKSLKEKLLNIPNYVTREARDELDTGLKQMLASLYQRYDNLSYHNAPGLRHHHNYLYKCRGGLGTYYIIPALLHFAAFLTMLRQMRIPETDKFHNLCVVTYLLMTKTVGRDKASSRLTRMVRGWLLFGATCLCITMTTHFLHLFVLSQESICFTFFQPSSDTMEAIMTGLCLVLFGLIDFSCIAIFTTYALHCELNVIFLNTNVTAMREKRIQFRDFTKNTEDSKTNLDYLNTRHSLGVSILLIHIVSRLVVVFIECFLGATQPRQSLLSGLAVTFWLSLVLMVLVQAARVTFACKSVRHIGHELRSRPFCYQSAPYSDLDSLLNYTSTLHMNARLLMIPIRASCVATIALVCVVVFLVLGQMNVIKF